MKEKKTHKLPYPYYHVTTYGEDNESESELSPETECARVLSSASQPLNLLYISQPVYGILLYQPELRGIFQDLFLGGRNKLKICT